MRVWCRLMEMRDSFPQSERLCVFVCVCVCLCACVCVCLKVKFECCVDLFIYWAVNSELLPPCLICLLPARSISKAIYSVMRSALHGVCTSFWSNQSIARGCLCVFVFLFLTDHTFMLRSAVSWAAESVSRGKNLRTANKVMAERNQRGRREDAGGCVGAVAARSPLQQLIGQPVRFQGAGWRWLPAQAQIYISFLKL